jgi:hypothetical protein
MKKAGTKNAGKQEATMKDAKPKNGKKKTATPRELPSERLGVPPTTPDVDAKVKAAEGTQDAPNGAAKTKEATTNASAGTGRDTGERGAKGGQPVAEGGKAMSLMDAAVDILSKGTGDPMRCKDIVDLAIKRSLWAPRTGKTPASTLYAAILREIVTKGDTSRFVKTERGRFALKDSEYVREAAAKSRKA